MGAAGQSQQKGEPRKIRMTPRKAGASPGGRSARFSLFGTAGRLLFTGNVLHRSKADRSPSAAFCFPLFIQSFLRRCPV